MIDAAHGLPPARWDEGSFELVVRNLISNAIKYGDEGEIRVEARGSDGAIEIRVFDEGPGLPTDEPSRLFELFYRTDDARRRAQGAGIGRPIVREAARSSAFACRRSSRPTISSTSTDARWSG